MRNLSPALLMCSLVAGSCALFVYAVLERLATLITIHVR